MGGRPTLYRPATTAKSTCNHSVTELPSLLCSLLEPTNTVTHYMQKQYSNMCIIVGNYDVVYRVNTSRLHKVHRLRNALRIYSDHAPVR